MKDVFLGYATNGTPEEDFKRCVQALESFHPKTRGHVHADQSAQNPWIPESRNALVQFFLGTTLRWLLFLDHDIVFRPEDVIALSDLASEKRPVVAGLYPLVKPDGEEIPSWHIERDGDPYCFPTLDELRAQKVHRLASTGMGFTLIHRSVFEALGMPSVANPWPWYGHEPDGLGHMLGEDGTFCKRLRARDVPIYGTTEANVGHIKKSIHKLNLTGA